jgi:hypothetical protein
VSRAIRAEIFPRHLQHVKTAAAFARGSFIGDVGWIKFYKLSNQVAAEDTRIYLKNMEPPHVGCYTFAKLSAIAMALRIAMDLLMVS